MVSKIYINAFTEFKIPETTYFHISIMDACSAQLTAQ